MKKFFIILVIALIAFLVGTTAFEKLDPENIVPNVVAEEAITCDVEELLAKKLGDEEDISNNTSNYKDFFSGRYTLNNYRFEEMNEVHILLSRNKKLNDDGTHSRKNILFAGVFTKLDDYGYHGFFSSISTQIDGNKVNFRTLNIKDIEYKFEGVFFKDKMPENEGEKVLRGTLQKIVKGKKVAEISGDFAYYEPHCWH